MQENIRKVVPMEEGRMKKGESHPIKSAKGIPECVVGEGSSMDGHLSCPGLIRIEGDCKGSLASDGTVVIAEGARVDAEIDAAEVVIAGQVIGAIRAKNLVDIHATAKVRATIEARRFRIEEGGLFLGSFKRKID